MDYRRLKRFKQRSFFLNMRQTDTNQAVQAHIVGQLSRGVRTGYDVPQYPTHRRYQGF